MLVAILIGSVLGLIVALCDLVGRGAWALILLQQGLTPWEAFNK